MHNQLSVVLGKVELLYDYVNNILMNESLTEEEYCRMQSIQDKIDDIINHNFTRKDKTI